MQPRRDFFGYAEPPKLTAGPRAICQQAAGWRGFDRRGVGREMTAGLIAHSVLSCLSGLSVAVTGFGCDISRELLHLLVAADDVYAPTTAINTGLAAALVTAAQVNHQLVSSREQIMLICLSVAERMDGGRDETGRGTKCGEIKSTV